MMLIDKKGCRLCAGSFKSGVRLAFINQMIEMDKYGRNDYFLFIVVFYGQIVRTNYISRPLHQLPGKPADNRVARVASSWN